MRRSRDFWIWTAIGLAGLMGFGLGLLGWSVYFAGAGKSGLGLISDTIYATILMFLADGAAMDAASGNLALHMARFLALAAGLGAILKTVLTVFADRIRRFRLSRFTDHVIVCGLDATGRAFLRNEHARREAASKHYRLVAIAPEPREADESWCREHDVYLVSADYRDTDSLDAVNAGKARRVVFTGPEDERNVEAALALRTLTEGRGEPALKAYAVIHHQEFWRQISQSDAVARLHDGLEIYPLSVPDIAARQFIWDEALYELAWLRGQPQVHVVFAGYDAYAESLLYTLLPSVLTLQLDRPRITVLTPDAALQAEKLKLLMPEIDKIADVTFMPQTTPLSPARMAEIADLAPVTAVFVFGENDTATLDRTLTIHTAMTRSDAWCAPLYPRMDDSDGTAPLLSPVSGTKRFGDCVIPWGLRQRSCDTHVFEGPLETYARAIHAGYVDSRERQVESDSDESRQESLNAWNRLSETKRQSNRRAADHIRAKLFSAGCAMPDVADLTAPGSFNLPTEEMMEPLADLEHRSWMAGRWVDGWRAGTTRDDRRRVHPDLMSDYDGLTEELKQYDRNQVILLDDTLIARRSARDATVRKDLSVGVVEGLADEESIENLMKIVLPGLVRENPDARWTVTVLPQGTESFIAPQVLGWLRAQDVPHRLFILDTGLDLPAPLMGLDSLDWIIDKVDETAARRYLSTHTEKVITATPIEEIQGPQVLDIRAAVSV